MQQTGSNMGAGPFAGVNWTPFASVRSKLGTDEKYLIWGSLNLVIGRYLYKSKRRFPY